MTNFKLEWIDAGREPKCAPNPAYPLGIDLDATQGAQPACKTSLPYPAKRCGWHLVECLVCRQRVMITTAGRPDDPRSVVLACMIGGRA